MYRRYLIEIQHAKRKVNTLVQNYQDILTVDSVIDVDYQTLSGNQDMAELRKESIQRVNDIAKKVANEKRTLSRTVADEDVRFICSLYNMFVDKATPDELDEYRKEVANVMVKTNILPYLVHIAVIYPADVYSSIATYKDTHLLYMTLTLIAYYAESSDLFTEAIAKTEFVVFCKKLLVLNSENHLNGKLTDIVEKILQACICIFHIISMKESCVNILRDADLTNNLQPYLKSSNDEMSLTAMAVIANIATEKEYDIIEANSQLVAKLMYLLHKGMEDESRVYAGWPCKKSGRAVRNLSKNDSNKKLLWDLNVLRTLTEMVRVGNEEQQLESVHAIWALAFDEDIRKDIMKDEDSNVLKVLNGLEKNTTNDDIKNACEKCLWTLNQSPTETSKNEIVSGTKDKEVKQAHDTEPTKGHIMISYQSQSRETMKEIKRILEEKNYKVWMDIENIGGSTLQAMAEAIENAVVVLICYSRKYKESENCRLEAEYTQELRKPFIPLKMEQGYKPDGWLGLMIGSRYFIDFSGKYKFEDKLVDLFRELDRILKPGLEHNQTDLSEVTTTTTGGVDNTFVTTSTGTKTLVPGTVVRPNDGSKGKTKEQINQIRQWSQSDVLTWLSKYKLNNCGLDELTGEEIWLLTKINNQTPDKIYEFLEKDLKIDTLLVKSRLVWALTELTL